VRGLDHRSRAAQVQLPRLGMAHMMSMAHAMP
jgi:hypothetical protein